MNPHEIDLHKELKKYFGFNQFKGLQEQVVKSIITGNNTFVIMPTGGGKSVCYQIPAIMADGLTVVISPLISLMQDQETNLNKIGVAAKSLTSFNTAFNLSSNSPLYFAPATNDPISSEKIVHSFKPSGTS